MKLKRLSLSLVFTLVLAMVPFQKTMASTQDFYFTNFTADYYLTKAEDGTSKLHVKEVLTAMFPMTDQNHGINREIPFYNQGRKNRTIKSQDALNLTVLRNGIPENINKIEVEKNYYNVYIGSADTYVHGMQVYTLEYDFTNVITEFDEDLNNVSGQENVTKLFQELYWDTNGTGWQQKFGRVTARLHMPTGILDKTRSDVWCYVGRYGANGSERCTIESIEDGFSFTAEDLGRGENLTFVVEFDPDTFLVVRDKNYALVALFVIEIAIIIFVLVKKYSRWQKEASKQRRLYHSLFTAPQYQPPEDKFIHVAEGEQIYLKKTRPSYVATLLELAVTKAITITKTQDEKKPKKYNWSIHLNVEPSTLSPAQVSMLNILANSGSLTMDEDIVIKKHKATKTLAGYAKSYQYNAEYTLSHGGYLSKQKGLKTSGRAISAIAARLITYGILMIVIASVFEDVIENIFDVAAVLIGGEFLPLIMVGLLVVAVTISTILTRQTEKYGRYSGKGIRLAKYLEGLEMYIKMAEQDRIKFLQSVEGADTSNAGIVKLYEKLLPWASLFGAEKSWVKELEKYYEIGDVPEDLDVNLLNGIISANIINDVNTAVNSSINYHEPSGGSGSSFSPGGGGGGFSGGGGGGGGGGGW